MGVLEACENYFGTSDLYKVLGVTKVASEEELRKGYYKVSLKVHPDRVAQEEVAVATQKFQVLGKVYAILTDKEQKAVYDEQGIVDEESSCISCDRDWYDYWRLLFKKVTADDIKNFEKTYKGTEEELGDIKKAYLKAKGDMDQIMMSVMCLQDEEEPRVRDIIQEAIDSGDLPAFDAFVNESEQKREARKRKAEKEAREAEKQAKKEAKKAAKEMKKHGLDDDDDSLKALIQKRQEDRAKTADSFLAAMEAKYCKPPTKAGKKAGVSKKGKK
ncbi:dnaJ homolog subfamily C member 9 [Protopterus annectens]|uniref:dnaJ homolog subfamily C member 9 n=1 Tax=Protopterus annectens TaxID=7888 RepID=UPI001CFA9DC4|nr:dnaJ homolog subfamily C member 9 [Protopterus annectens]